MFAFFLWFAIQVLLSICSLLIYKTTETSMRQLQGAGPKSRPWVKFCIFMCRGKPFLSLSLSISLFNPKMDKKERPKTCSQLKTRNLSLCLYISLFNPKMDKKERSKHAGPQLKRRKNKDSNFYIVWMQSHSWIF